MTVRTVGRAAPLLVILGLGACAAPDPEKSTQRFLHETMIDEGVVTPSTKADPSVKENRDEVTRMQGRVVVSQTQGRLVEPREVSATPLAAPAGASSKIEGNGA